MTQQENGEEADGEDRLMGDEARKEMCVREKMTWEGRKAIEEEEGKGRSEWWKKEEKQ